MAVSTIALYASPTGGVCSTPHGININAHASYDFDLNSRSTSPASSTTASSSKKPITGGLSCLFASPPIKHVSPSSFPVGGDDLGSYRGEELKELSSSFCYSSSKFAAASSSRNNQSPVSVLQGPVPCSSGSSPMRIQGSFRGGASGLFSGFVRGALGSCVDYDSPSFESQNRGFVDEELTFNMDDSFVGDMSAEPYARELLLDAQLRHKIFTEDFVVKAFYEAEKAHRGQMRASGDPYLRHCVETAILLALIGANSRVVAAGLLHDTFDDAFLSYDDIFRTFGAGVADLVEGVSKLSQLSKLARENDTACKTVEADRLHTMFLAMADARAVLIKLADRLHNMMTLDALSSVKQQRFAKETLEIFTPLANRLGISSWKEQLENLCFKYLHPEEHKEISSRFMVSYDQEMITSAVEKLERALKDKSIVYHVLSGRHKSLYSIYRKMLKKKLTMDEIHDIHGLRIIVESKEDCYDALNVVHQIWSEVPGKLKDYIAHPKFNGYESLHTVVMGDCLAPLEVQIRTKEMHLQAEFGFAAHWRYKEGDHKQSLFVLQMVEWARWVLTWHCETANKEHDPIDSNDHTKLPCTFPSHSIDCPYAYNAPCGDDRPVFVIVIENDKMSVQEFQANATVMDILERAGRVTSRWSPYGFPIKEELRPRLNQEPVGDLTCKLKMGDVVELTPAIPDKLLVEYREEFKRMYDRNLAVSGLSPITGTTLASRS